MKENNPMYRPEVRAKVAKHYADHPEKHARIMKALNEGKQRQQRDQPSKLELRLRGYLDTMGVAYEPSAMIKDKFIVDIRIGNIIIQADGDYWHGHPRFEPLTERQIKQQRRDNAQDKYLTKCGYIVIRIWEKDMCYELVKHLMREHGVI